MTLEDLTRYQNAGLAAKLYQSEENRHFANGALEQLASDLGVEKNASGFIKGAFASKEGIETAIQIYAKDYVNALQETSIGNLYLHYGDILENYLGSAEEKKKVKLKFDKYSKMNFGDVMKEIGNAEYKTKDKYDNFSEKDKEKAKDVLKKYEEIISLINLLEEIKFEKLRPSATERTHKQMLKEFIKELPDRNS